MEVYSYIFSELKYIYISQFSFFSPPKFEVYMLLLMKDKKCISKFRLITDGSQW